MRRTLLSRRAEQFADHGQVAEQRDAAGVVVEAVLHQPAEDGDLAAAQAQHGLDLARADLRHAVGDNRRARGWGRP